MVCLEGGKMVEELPVSDDEIKEGTVFQKSKESSSISASQQEGEYTHA